MLDPGKSIRRRTFFSTIRRRIRRIHLGNPRNYLKRRYPPFRRRPLADAANGLSAIPPPPFRVADTAGRQPQPWGEVAGIGTSHAKSIPK